MDVARSGIINKINLLVLPTIIFLLVVFLYPLTRVFWISLFDPGPTLEHYHHFITTPTYLRVFIMTFRLGLTVTTACLILGYPVAYLLANTTPKWRNLLMIFVILPFWASLLVRTYAWMVILQRNGILNHFLIDAGIIDRPIKLIYNTIGVNIGMVNILLPFMILILYSVMKGIDKDLIKAAQNLGAPPFQAFLRVFFPLSLPGVAGGSLLIFVIAIGFFITPALMGGLKDITISMLIENQVRKLLNWGFASALSVILLIITVIIVLVYNYYLGLDRLLGKEKV